MKICGGDTARSVGQAAASRRGENCFLCIRPYTRCNSAPTAMHRAYCPDRYPCCQMRNLRVQQHHLRNLMNSLNTPEFRAKSSAVFVTIFDIMSCVAKTLSHHNFVPYILDPMLQNSEATWHDPPTSFMPENSSHVINVFQCPRYKLHLQPIKWFWPYWEENMHCLQMQSIAANILHITPHMPHNCSVNLTTTK